MKIYLISFFLFTLNSFAQSALSGRVTDADTGEPILFGDVVIYQNGKLITGAQTDFDGGYIISPMSPGKYSIVFKYVRYGDVKIEKVVVRKNKETNLNVTIRPGVPLEEMIVPNKHWGYYIPLVEEDTIIQKDTNRLPNTNMTGIIDNVKSAEKEENNN